MWNSTWKIVSIYFVLSTIWFLTSEQLSSILASSVQGNEVYFRIGHDAFYICVSSCIFYFIVQSHKKSHFKSEAQYRQLFFSNPNPLWIYDKKTLKFIEVNNAAIRQYGYNRGEFRKMTILDIRPKEDREKVVEAVRDREKKYNVSGNWLHQKKNGEVIMVAITSHEIQAHGKECVMVMAQDITTTVKHEAALKEAYETEKELREELEKTVKLIKKSGDEKQRLAEVTDRINNMVIITDPFGNITWVNRAFTNFTGYSINDLVGKTTKVLHGPKTDPGIQNLIMESLEKNEFSTFEVLNYTKSGQEYWVEFTLSAIYNKKNEVERYISIQNVVTERKEREEKIKAYNTALKKLAWTNSHAVRKPVASILGLLDLCKSTDKIEEIKELHLLINTCAVELDLIVREMGTEISKYETSEFS